MIKIEMQIMNCSILRKINVNNEEEQKESGG
jgi:hypothetical protein